MERTILHQIGLNGFNFVLNQRFHPPSLSMLPKKGNQAYNSIAIVVAMFPFGERTFLAR